MGTRNVAVITGGGGSLGRQSALQLSAAGYAIAVNGRTEVTLKETVAEVESQGGAAIAVAGDASEADTIDRLFAASLDAFGPCTAFVHCAATHGTPMTFANMPVEEWDYVIRTNLRSTYLATHAAVNQMVPEKAGAIVLVSSAGTRRGFPLATAYAATKSALDGFVRTLAAEVSPEGVRVNVLVPGAMPDSDIYKSAMPGIAEELGFPPEDGLKLLEDMSALRRGCTPAEMAQAVVFLATDQSSAMTGQSLVVDGGLSV